MINTIATIISTGVVVGGAIGCILSAFYKTNNQATNDYEKIEKNFDKKIADLKKDFENRIHDLKQDINNSTDEKFDSLKDDFKSLAEKIEDMKSHYVSNDNFKTYADAMGHLLQMNSDRMERIENTLDTIRDDLNEFIRGN